MNQAILLWTMGSVTEADLFDLCNTKQLAAAVHV